MVGSIEAEKPDCSSVRRQALSSPPLDYFPNVKSQCFTSVLSLLRLLLPFVQ